MTTTPRDLEVSLARRWGIVAGMDEVGCGALTGPVAVGVAFTGIDAVPVPGGLTDPKALTTRRCEALIDPAREWTLACAIGYASPQEIDNWGITAALRLAGWHTLAEVASHGFVPGGALLDGSHDWLSAPDDLFGAIDGPGDPFGVGLSAQMQMKADAFCTVVAAASVLAKVERDHLMAELKDPGCGWASNKSYGSTAHTRAIVELDVSDQYRCLWKMPTQATKQGAPGWHDSTGRVAWHDGCVSEEIEGHENNLELELFKEYRDVIGLSKYVMETKRRSYLYNRVDVQARPIGGDVFLELTLSNAWVWDIYRSSRFVHSVRVITYRDVNAGELPKPELDIP